MSFFSLDFNTFFPQIFVVSLTISLTKFVPHWNKTKEEKKNETVEIEWKRKTVISIKWLSYCSFVIHYFWFKLIWCVRPAIELCWFQVVPGHSRSFSCLTKDCAQLQMISQDLYHFWAEHKFCLWIYNALKCVRQFNFFETRQMYGIKLTEKQLHLLWFIPSTFERQW